MNTKTAVKIFYTSGIGNVRTKIAVLSNGLLNMESLFQMHNHYVTLYSLFLQELSILQRLIILTFLNQLKFYQIDMKICLSLKVV